jgi:hypothetical protein
MNGTLSVLAAWLAASRPTSWMIGQSEGLVGHAERGVVPLGLEPHGPHSGIFFSCATFSACSVSRFHLYVQAAPDAADSDARKCQQVKGMGGGKKLEILGDGPCGRRAQISAKFPKLFFHEGVRPGRAPASTADSPTSSLGISSRNPHPILPFAVAAGRVPPVALGARWTAKRLCRRC